MKLRNYFAGAMLLACSAPVWATVCANSSGVATDVPFDLSNVFNSNNNAVGQIVTLPETPGRVGVYAICPPGTEGNTTLRSYMTDLPVEETLQEYKYLKLNDYLNGAISINDDTAGRFYPPVNYIQMGNHPYVSQNTAFPVTDSRLTFRLKVTRRFVDKVIIPKQVMFRVYVTTRNTDPLDTVVYTISYSGVVEVPQTCAINAGQIVEFDFGDIYTVQFDQIAAGEMPKRVIPITKKLGIKCSNINAEAYLSLRLEAERSSGNFMLSDNPDLGFKVSQANGSPLIPNNVASKIPFQLDAAAEAEVVLRAHPVSITGNIPADGPFVARGYLRVDYD